MTNPNESENKKLAGSPVGANNTVDTKSEASSDRPNNDENKDDEPFKVDADGKSNYDTDAAKFGWKVALGHTFSKKWCPLSFPRLSVALSFLPQVLGYLRYYIPTRLRGKRAFIDVLSPVKSQQMYGVPIGGLGSGTIGRGFNGEFCRFHLIPGTVSYNTPIADQFIVSVRTVDEGLLYQKVLSVSGRGNHKELSSWDFNLDGYEGDYCGLYPRSWTTYHLKECGVKLIVRQISPIIPADYKDSSLPCAVFVWTVENCSDQQLSVSIAFTFRNGCGSPTDNKGRCWSEASDDSVMLHHEINNHDVTYCIAVNNEGEGTTSICPSFNPCGRGEGVWCSMLSSGDVPTEAAGSDEAVGLNSDTNPVPALGVAACRKVCVDPHSSTEVQFCLSWDVPTVTFGGGAVSHKRRYTRWFNGSDASARIARHALNSYKDWERKIAEWQSPVLNNKDLPEWFKSALFNELYYLADGGSLWIDMPNDHSLRPGDPRSEFGRYGYLESQEYRMFNTYDVHYYSSWALIMLWPKLQAGLQYDFAEFTLSEQPEMRRIIWDSSLTKRKKSNSVPHDLGDPDDEPFIKVNGYMAHCVSEWKDLNLKFVIQVYRDYHFFNEDIEFLRFMWPACRAVLQRSLSWDTDGDGLIENKGADQTYDAWQMTGPSAYCSNLWLSALSVMQELSIVMEEIELQEQYAKLLEKATESLQQKLWNGSYYNFDSANNSHSKVIMADQLVGYWYLSLSQHKKQVFPKENILKTLRTIYENNVLLYCDGKMGAVNGMHPAGGGVDISTVQSEEMWTGSTYALASTMIKEGMVEEGFHVAEGVYRTVYEEAGLAFDTPEALQLPSHYRAVGYMRPLSIWSIYHAWQLQSK